MTWFTIFTTLLAVQFTVSDVVVIISDVKYDTELPTQIHYGADRCELETNTGQKYQFELGSTFESITDRILHYPDSCRIIINRAILEDAGEWKITTFFNTSDLPSVTETFKLYIKQMIEVIPNSVTITEGYFAYAELNLDKKNITNCTIAVTDEYSYNVEIDLLNEHSENFQRIGQCGARILVNSNTINRQCVLQAVVEDKFIYYGHININILKNTKEPEEMQVITLDRGERGQGNFYTGRSIRFCQLEDPMGLKTPFYESCFYNIPVVTSRHDGVWIARYGVHGNPDLIIQRFRVVVRDTSGIDSNVTVTENNEIQLFCHVYEKTAALFQFCHFTRPDGHMLNLEPGIGTASYRAFNVSEFGERYQHYNRKNHVYCGLIIRQPKQYDYGGWKCGISIENAKFYKGSIIYVDPSIMNANETREREIKIVAENVYVKRNDSFQIKCTADAVLSYCWFRSPNGTSYSVSEMQNQSPTTLPYVGLGLNLGECVVEVDHATHTDHGEWTCNVGALDGPEKSEKFFVNVTESYVIPEHSLLVANYEDDITLSCNLHPNLTDKEIRYCRWVHPDGYGIHNGLSHRYTVNQTDTQCRLIIPNMYKEESIGRWTCVARLYGLEDEESSATIIVCSQSATTYLLTIISVIVTLLLIAILCISSYIYVHKRRRAPSDDPQACISNDKNNLAKFFIKVHPVIGNCNKSFSRKIVE